MAKKRRRQPATNNRWKINMSMVFGGLIVLFLAIWLVFSASQEAETAAMISSPESSPPLPSPTPFSGEARYYTYKIINQYPHDPEAFTQGLIYEADIFYEGTGLYNESTLRKVEPESGKVIQKIALPAQFFGEGITIFGDKVIQLTWKSQTGFVYDKESFELERQFNYPTEGWGLTHNGEQLIMSDGTANLYFLDPEDFSIQKSITVQDKEKPIPLLNELEYIQGIIYANIWKTNHIIQIDPHSGQVMGWIDLSNLLKAEDITPSTDVLNGIAYDAEQERLFITGKKWPKLFEIELVVEKNGAQ